MKRVMDHTLCVSIKTEMLENSSITQAMLLNKSTHKLDMNFRSMISNYSNDCNILQCLELNTVVPL